MKKAFVSLLASLAMSLAVVPTAATSATLSTTGYTQTKYPIVLVHGWLGWDNIAAQVRHFLHASV